MNIHKRSGSDGKDEDSLPDELNEDLETYRLSEEEKVSVSVREVESALDNVLSRIDEGKTKTDFDLNWRLLAIAAAITFLGLLVVLSIPVSVEVPNGEVSTVNLPDGTSVTLNSGSELTYSRFYDYMGRNVTLSGEGFFDVESDPDNPFTVKTLNSSVVVLGTKFNLSDWNVETGPKAMLTVTEGSVEFADLKGSNSIVLTENESALVTESFEVVSYPFERDNTLAWLSNNVSFQNETLVQAFDVLERRFNISIDLSEDVLLESESITAFYHDPQNPESIIQDICTIKGLSYQKTHNGYKITAN